jgi:hypothetical protein
MRFGFPILGIVALSLLAAPSNASYSRGHHHHRYRPLRSHEVHVEQARGSLPDKASVITDKGTPESGPPGTPTTGSPSIPPTCDQQNASSPACYSATQQARPVGR